MRTCAQDSDSHVLGVMMIMSTATMTHSGLTVAPPPAVRGQGRNLDKHVGNQVYMPIEGPPLSGGGRVMCIT